MAEVATLDLAGVDSDSAAPTVEASYIPNGSTPLLLTSTPIVIGDNTAVQNFAIQVFLTLDQFAAIQSNSSNIRFRDNDNNSIAGYGVNGSIPGILQLSNSTKLFITLMDQRLRLARLVPTR